MLAHEAGTVIDSGTGEGSVPWWKEPTRDQWFAWVAAALGWTVDGFDFTIFLFLMAPIASEFQVSLTAVASVLSLTLWMRLLGAVGAGWLADRIGRKAPLIISILWFSVCNFIAGFSPNFTFLFIARVLFGLGMGAEWAAGASLAMESWPARSRGLMGYVMSGGFALGFALASLVYWMLSASIGWRGLLWIGILPALLCIYINLYVKDPTVWVENRRLQRELNQEVRAPFFVLFTPPLLRNTLSACWWTAGCGTVYYAIYGMFATWLEQELRVDPAVVATPVLLSNLVALLACWPWGGLADRIGRRGTSALQAIFAALLAPIYLLTRDISWIIIGFIVQGGVGGMLPLMSPSYLSERFPTDVRATAMGFCYQVGIVCGGFVPVLVSYVAVEQHTGFAVPMLIATWVGAISVVGALLISPETKGKSLSEGAIASTLSLPHSSEPQLL